MDGAPKAAFLPTSQLLATDGILVSRANASSSPDGGGAALRGVAGGFFGGSGLNAVRSVVGAGGGGGASGRKQQQQQSQGAAAGMHDNYLTGGVLVGSGGAASSSSSSAAAAAAAPDPGDLHSLPNGGGGGGHPARLPPMNHHSSTGGFLPSVAARHGMQVTAAARARSGELVAVPQMGGHSHNPSATHPSIDGGARYDRAFIFGGFVAPTARTVTDEVDATIRGEVDAAQSAAARAAQVAKMVTIVQSLARMRFQRRRYLLHRERLTAVLERVFYEQQMRCALLIQKCARRMVARHKYLRLRAAMWQRFLNGGSKGGAGGRKGGGSMLLGSGGRSSSNVGGNTSSRGGGAAAPNGGRRPSLGAGGGASGKPNAPLPEAPYAWLEGSAERNFTFVVALKAMVEGRLEEAKHAFESFSSQQSGGDKVALRLAHCCDARLRAIANLVNGGRPGGGVAGDVKKGAAAGAGAKGAKGGSKASPSPSRKR